MVGEEVACVIAVSSLMPGDSLVALAVLFVPKLSAICSRFADIPVDVGSVEGFESL